MFTAKDSRLHRKLEDSHEIKFPYQFQKKESFGILVILINRQKNKARKKVIALCDSVLAKCCKKAFNFIWWPPVLLKPKLLLRKKTSTSTKHIHRGQCVSLQHRELPPDLQKFLLHNETDIKDHNIMQLEVI